MNRDKYHDKYLELLNMEQFEKQSHNANEKTERKKQITLRNIK